MFDEYGGDGNKPARPELKLKEPLIVIACAGGGMLLSLGLCGANLAIRRQTDYSSGVLGIAGLVLFGLSVLSLIGGFLWLVAASLINAFRH